ncbi:MAG: CoA-acylating methylmalonate-semialdehyde dehydrogenase [Gammaproteobacteria bacterium]|nr:CoA-acylating methylmalonate-semialdehyde dehydrogenase [Gammaproteobacteria bacterium]
MITQAPSPEFEAEVVPAWIDGKPRIGDPASWGVVYNPATGYPVRRVPFASPADVDAALCAATTAWPEWANTPAVQRARVLFRFKALIEEHQDELVALISEEHGKVLSDARGSLQRGLEVVEFACGAPNLLKGEYSEQVGTGVDCYAMRQPLGVCVGITPFNFPAMVPMWMFPLAIACGNAFILKPSEKVPSCATRLAELLTDAGLPPGVMNVVHGDKSVVDALLEDPRVAAVSFVGSTPVAEYVHQTASASGKRVQALGGAKNHMVVMPDANLDNAVDALLGAAYGSAGERCMAISVVVAVSDAGDEVRRRLIEKLTRLKVGPGSDPESEMGPLVTEAHRERVAHYIQAGVDEGAELVMDGRQPRDRFKSGFFLGPSLFDHATSAMRIYREEIFGPVLTMVRANTLDEAVGLVNQHEYGNGTAIFTRDGGVARDYASRVNIGMVGINVAIPVPMAFHSFGGWKRSLFGDLAMHGAEGVRFYTRLKTVSSRWPEGSSSSADFNMPVNK